MNDFHDQRLEYLEKQLVKRGPIDSQLTLVFSRLVVPLMTAGLMAFGSWVVNHISGAIDSHTGQLNKMEGAVAHINQYLDLHGEKEELILQDIRLKIADHEERLRVLERLIDPAPSRPSKAKN